jgi:translation initiation factor IF-3
MAMNKSRENEPRMNDEIRNPTIRLIDAEGNMLGIVPVKQGLEMAAEAGLDLVEISPTAEPPVCKILDYGKFKYEAQKKANEARKKQKVVALKEIKMRPNIDPHDYGIKMKNVRKFIEEGDKVKFTLRFRGREMSHQELGMKLMQQVKADLGETIKVESEPRLEGRQMVMVIAPAAT